MRRVLILACGAALLTTMAACSQTQSGTPQPQAGPVPTSAASSGVTIPGMYTSVAKLAEVSGAAMKAKKTATFTLSGGLGDQQDSVISGRGELRFDDAGGVSMSTTTKLPGANGKPPQETTMVLTQEGAFYRLPAEEITEQGKPWVKITKDGQDFMSRILGPMIAKIREQSDPSAALELVKSAGSITGTTSVTLDGVPTTKYAISIDLVKAAGLATDPLSKLGLETLISQGVKTSLQEAWLDAENLLVQFGLTQETPAGKVTALVRYRDWGQPVTIQAPSPAEIAAPLAIPTITTPASPTTITTPASPTTVTPTTR